MRASIKKTADTQAAQKVTVQPWSAKVMQAYQCEQMFCTFDVYIADADCYAESHCS